MLGGLKAELLKEIEEKERVRKTVEGVPPYRSKTIGEIYDALEKSGEKELAARFRDASNDPQIVKILKKALEEGRLVDEARKLLTRMRMAKPMDHKPVKLRGICWCVITP